jgi:carbon-monoxide dehydrogenase small subunit
MSEKAKEKKEHSGISRREFLKDAGLIAGGTVIGNTILLSACKGGETTKTETVTTTLPGQTVTTTTTLPGTGAATITATITEQPTAEVIEGAVTLNVNGEEHLLKVEPDWSLAFVLRNKLDLFSVKEGCNMGECGACTVLMDGVPIYSCLILAVEAVGKKISTLEGLSDGITLHPIQQSFVDNYGYQCGYCTPGMIMATKALLDANPSPTRDEVRQALAGHVCICTGYTKIVDSVVKAGG